MAVPPGQNRSPAPVRLSLGRCPRGPSVGAFLDLDNTVVCGYSALALARDLAITGRLAWWDLPEGVGVALGVLRESDGFTAAMAMAARLLAGLREEVLVAMGERLFHEEYRHRIHPEARHIVEAHRARGHTVVIASAATRYQVEPIARELGVAHVLCTRFETQFGSLTGRLQLPACRGAGKRAAAERFASAHGVALGKSFFYTDGAEDLPLLRAVGRPRPTNPGERLSAVAGRRGWPILRFPPLPVPSARPLRSPGPSGAPPSLGEWWARAREETERARFRLARWSARDR